MKYLKMALINSCFWFFVPLIIFSKLFFDSYLIGFVLFQVFVTIFYSLVKKSFILLVGGFGFVFNIMLIFRINFLNGDLKLIFACLSVALLSLFSYKVYTKLT